MQHEGNRLESCGYGPDGKLAVNTGLFLGYKRSTQTPNGPDDWFEISGHARPGDSGGGVFNERGRLVGVLWGTNGEVVVGVQAGRLHVLLDAATAARRSIRSPTRRMQFIRRANPTPPKPAVPIESLPPACDGSGGCCPLPGPIFDEPASRSRREEARRRGPAVARQGAAARRRIWTPAPATCLQAIEAERRARRRPSDRSRPPPASRASQAAKRRTTRRRRLSRRW